ncbi:AAA family ATPase, partial [candidate division KSB1 bacterium]|nr:AAA family ATPase [candidate division KSB1 bacterium]
TQTEVFKSCVNPVRFILSAEISNIYKKHDSVRKIHNVVMAPSFKAARNIQAALDKIGNIRSDGRPILGLDAKDLLDIVLNSDDLSCLIPAHIWTPWFSVLGSKSGFDSIEECFEDLTSHIFAVETGLSSDPPMNWQVSSLDKFTLVSNSDAHSPQKLAREANIFKCDLSYSMMLEALKSGAPDVFGGTLEFFPEEGKYHLDGHRKCSTRMTPEETIANKGLCPVCGKKVTVGVSYRVAELADRKPGEKSQRALPFESLIPLPEIISEVKQKGVNTKTVGRQVENLLSKLGPELTILRDTALNDIEKAGGSLVAEAVRRMRTGELHIAGGYDGEFGTIKIFNEEERAELETQKLFMDSEIPGKSRDQKKKKQPVVIQDEFEEFKISPATAAHIKDLPGNEDKNPFGLNDLQLQAVNTVKKNLLIVAGPGTGKTRTLTYRIANLIQNEAIDPESVLAVTFTNKATEEMRDRLRMLLDQETAAAITIKTFHAFGAMILRNESGALDYNPDFSIYDESERHELFKQIAGDLSKIETNELLIKISEAKSKLLPPDHQFDDPEFAGYYSRYQKALATHHAFDFDDLIFQPVLLFQNHPKIADKYRKKYRWISVDEYQDINYAQYTLLQLLTNRRTNICAIGDPDQAIYGFRGSDYKYFLKFDVDFPGAVKIDLIKNYRSNQNILTASEQVIRKNPDRLETKVWSDIISKGRLEVFKTPTEKSEAETIIHQIEKMVGATSFFSVDSGRAGDEESEAGVSFGDIAVLYRLHAQLPALEEAFIRSGIPYQTIGEIPFWQKKEVREIVHYLSAIQNPNSDIDLSRIILLPPCNINKHTLRVISGYKDTNELTLWQALEKAGYISSLSEIHKQPLNIFVKKIHDLRESSARLSVAELIDEILKQSGIKSYYKSDRQRAHYWKQVREFAANWNITLNEFLERIKLQHENDIYDPKAERVALMSLHASKGLEFPVVFIAGCEDGVLPYRPPQGKVDNLGEERRLFYVGMTRAKLKLILTYSASRFLFGERRSNISSRFVSDIEQTLKESRSALLKQKKKSPIPNDLDSQMTLF